MKFLLAFVAIIAAASSAAVRPKLSDAELGELYEVIAAIHNPSTDPATAAALEQMLYDIFGHDIVDNVAAAVITGEPINISPVMVEELVPIAPIFVEQPSEETIPTAPIFVEQPHEEPSAVAPTPGSVSSPLVQIIVNVQGSASPVSVIAPETPVPAPSPVHVVDSEDTIVPTPVVVVDSEDIVVPTPVIVVDSEDVVPTPVIVVDSAPEAVVPSPIIVENIPVVPAPVIVEDLPTVPAPVFVPEVVLPEPVIVPTPAVIQPRY